MLFFFFLIETSELDDSELDSDSESDCDLELLSDLKNDEI